MVFERELAKIYDLIYRDKDYEGECDFVERIFQRFSPKSVKSILDGGCGAGGHAIPLAKRGYEVTGIDSSKMMIKEAKEKAVKANLNIDFQTADLRQFSLNRRFDACLCMFAVLGYITETKKLLQTLENIRGHLNKESLFICDVWNGLAVMRILPSVRVKTVEDEGKRIIRIAQPELDAFNHLCRVHYHLLITQDDGRLSEFEETHTVRYFFPQEIIHYLEESGFELVAICPFLDLDGKVDESVWNMTIIAKAI